MITQAPIPCTPLLDTNTHTEYYFIPYNEGYAQFVSSTASVLSSIGGYIQLSIMLAAKDETQRNWEARSQSLYSWSYSLLANICWIIYGMMLHDRIIIAACSIGALGSALVIVICVYYKSYWKGDASNRNTCTDYQIALNSLPRFKR